MSDYFDTNKTSVICGTICFVAMLVVGRSCEVAENERDAKIGTACVQAGGSWALDQCKAKP